MSAEEVQRATEILRARIATAGIPGCVFETRDHALALWVEDASEPRIAALRELAESKGEVSLRVRAERIVAETTSWDGPAPSGFRWYDRSESDETQRVLLEFPESAEPEADRAALVRARVFTDGDLDPAGFRVVDHVVLRHTGAAVAFRTRPERAEDFRSFTRAIVGRQLALVIDDRVRAMPVVNSELQGAGEISGPGMGFTEPEARALVALLAHGRLPCRLVLRAREPSPR